MRNLLAVMHDIASKRASAFEKLEVMLPKQTFAKPSAADDDSDFTDDESCYGPRPDVPSFYNSYSNGKVAVRTEVGPFGEPPPLPAGVHGFVRDDLSPLFELTCKGPGAPVVFLVAV